VINKQANILFIPTSISGNSAKPQAALSQNSWFQQLIYASLARSTYTIEGFQVLGRQLAAIARHACLAKQMGAVEQASQLMLALPISGPLEKIARYYQALCAWRRGDMNSACQFERAVEELPPEYKARALQVVGLTYQQRGDLDAALPFYLAAGKAAASCDWLTLADSQRITAIVRGIHGDHKQAVADLENLFPLIRAISKYYPATYYDFLNGLAVELSEVGRVSEAEAALSIALASPFAPAYPEWSETRDEIDAKRQAASPSVVAIHRVPEGERTAEADRIPETDRAIEADRAIKAESQRKPEPSRPVAFISSASDKDFFQRSVLTIPARITIALNAVSILDRMRLCIGPRAPPALC
jgi:tetratricopeptide (TPR) repeat protein